MMLLSLDNGGVDTATNAEVSVDLTVPAGVSVGTPSASSGVVSGAAPNFLWTLSSLLSGGSATLTVALDVDSTTDLGTGVIGIVAAVTTVDQPDANAFDGVAAASTSVTCPDADGDGACDAADNTARWSSTLF